ncbi:MULTISPECIES: Imm1 family immunity protein [unclassified Nitrobacter]|uniref:Imm1 family immunity protein n=1 Tax=unclassified Nitrobacter TaxID=2620411 RepID=UPI00092A241D|nr:MULTISPECIES: Imm1 family immunity protein [unclassified Nitrobacter]MBN9147613.1 hypothetical protein [Nitrobacter sp.]OJV02972.1 MAG: hypothetical protein BGO16_03345 [Nitrobacter sp. 62-23]
MKRFFHFDNFASDRWPELSELERFFLAPKGQEWSFQGGNDSWGMDVQGLCGTDGLPREEQVNVHFYMTGNPDLGVTLLYDKWDGRIQRKQTYNSKGDLRRLGEFVRSLHGTPLSVGLFVPFPVAWKAVKEFIETDGELPTSIEWIADSDLPPETFPDP